MGGERGLRQRNPNKRGSSAAKSTGNFQHLFGYSVLERRLAAVPSITFEGLILYRERDRLGVGFAFPPSVRDRSGMETALAKFIESALKLAWPHAGYSLQFRQGNTRLFIERGRWLSLAAVMFVPETAEAYDILVDGKLVKSIGPEKLMKDTESWRSRENYEAAFSQVTAPRLRGALAEIEDPLRSFLSSWKGTDFPRRQEVEVTLGEILSGNR